MPYKINIKQELVKQCRYYGGEDECPYDDEGMSWFWEMERVFVANGGELFPMHECYENINGRSFPGIPYPLLIVMFTSWGKGVCGVAEEIGRFYEVVEDYLDIPSGHFPKDIIPNGDSNDQ